MDHLIYPGLAISAQTLIKHGVILGNGELDIVAAACCDEYDITIKEFKSRTRLRTLADARKIFYLICRRDLHKFTCQRLGTYTGRDHSTVTVAVQRAAELTEIDRSFRVKYNHAKMIARQRLKLNGYEFNGMPEAQI